MRKFAKGCLIAALIMAVAGFAFVAASAATGGLAQTMDLIDDGALSIDGEDFGHITIYSHNNYHTQKAGEHSGTAHTTDGVAASEVDSLDIDIQGGYLNIRPAEGDTFYADAADGRYSRAECYVENNTLYIQQKYTVKNLWKIWKWNRRKAPEAILYIPAACGLQNVNIDIGAGEIEMYDMTVGGKMDIDMGAGEIEMYNMTVSGKMDVDMGAGEIYGEKLNASELDVDVGAGEAAFCESIVENAKFSVSMGSAEYEGRITKDLEADCSMGSILLNLDGSMEEHNYTVDCSMGEIELDDRSYSGVINEMNIDNGADSKFTIDCAMGSIEVYFKEK